MSVRSRIAAVVAPLALLVTLAGAPADAAQPIVYRLRGIAGARQVIAVTNASWTSTYATFQAFEKRADGSWRLVFGPWTARIGRNGFGSAKREGDGQSPVGSFTVPKTFGVRANPGVRIPWFRVVGNDVWVDDAHSAYYNRHMRAPAYGRWRSAESLYQPTAYAYAAFIGYNLAATPGYGSAIFLHASTGSATAGCVSLPQSQVVSVLRWLDPAKSPRFVMGPESAVT
jgi:L,D-peptidoglycan transpeptidase YkuD (ErfK/YbiS/YcfS/YnhG family)